MTPKEKADQLFNKMKGFRVKHIHSKKCALIAVDEILKIQTMINDLPLSEIIMEAYPKFWKEVKTEIEKL